jgi:hypothetical protein
MGIKEIGGTERASSVLANKLKEYDDFPTNLNNNNKHSSLSQNQSQQTSSINLLPQTNTTNSSRKSSVSEYVYGTPPLSYLSSRTLIHEREVSFNLADEQTIGDMIRSSQNSISASHALMKSSNSINHDILKRHPKCFGAKFMGQPGKVLPHKIYVK